MNAANVGDYRMVQLLVQHGADPFAKVPSISSLDPCKHSMSTAQLQLPASMQDNSGKMAVNWASRRGHQGIVQFLERAMRQGYGGNSNL